MPRLKTIGGCAAVFALAFANCLWWASRIPFDGAPDEADQFALVSSVATRGALPHYGDDGLSVKLMDATLHQRYTLAPRAEDNAHFFVEGHEFELRKPYLFTPQLPYWVAGMLCRLGGGATLLRARAVSALHIALTALWAMLGGLLVFRRRIWRAHLAGLSVALWPQITFVGAYVNDDSFAFMTSGLLILSIVWIETRGLSLGRALLFGVALGLVASSKYYAFAIFPLVAWWAIGHLRREKRSAGHFALAAMVAFALATPWFLRNVQLYADPLARRAATGYLHAAAASLPEAWRNQTVLLSAATPTQRGITLWSILKRGWLFRSVESFWACFHWMDYTLPIPLYVLAGVVLPLALFWPRSDEKSSIVHRFGWPFLLLLLAFSFYNTYVDDYQPQGRYLLPCVVPLVLALYDRFANDETRWRRIAPSLLALFFVFENVAANLTSLTTRY